MAGDQNVARVATREVLRVGLSFVPRAALLGGKPTEARAALHAQHSAEAVSRSKLCTSIGELKTFSILWSASLVVALAIANRVYGYRWFIPS